MMDGVNSAATLSLEISTDSAVRNLTSLNAAYDILRANIANGIGTPTLSQSSEEVTKLKSAFAGLSSTSAKEITDLKGQVAELQATLKTLSVTAKDTAATSSAVISGMAVKSRTDLKKMGDEYKQITAAILAEKLELAQSGVDFSSEVKGQRLLSQAATENAASLGRYITKLKEVKVLLSTTNSPELLKQTFGSTILGEIDNIDRYIAKLAALKATVPNPNPASVTATQWLAEDKDIAANQRMLKASGLDASSLKARLEARNRALVDAVNKSTSDLVSEMRAANAARQKAEDDATRSYAKWTSLTEKQRASATLQAAKALYGVGQAGQALLPGVAGSSQALGAAQSMGSVAAAATALSSLTDSHRALTPATTASAEGQINWNHVAKEGHTIARGLAGSLGSLWITYGQLAPLLAGAALGGAFVHAAKAGSEFAYQLTFVKALAQETSAAVELLGQSTLSLGKNSLQGPSEIASGYRVLAQAGLNVTDSISAMPQVLHLATVGEMDMEASALTLVGVLNAFGLSINGVEHVGDVFAKAAAVSQTSVQEMTQAMKTASVVGEQYGASMEDTATALTLLAKVNIRGTAAGTAFRNMLKELYAPVAGSAKVFEKLGVSAQDAIGNVRPFADVVFDLKGKLESFNKGDQVKILQKLFGERGAKEAIAMMALTREQWIELRDSIANSEGFMDGVAKELEDTAKGRWAKAVNTMKTTFIEAFTEMEPAFKDLADSFRELFSNKQFVDGTKQIVGAMVSLTSVLVEAAPLVIRLAEAWLILKAATISTAVWTAASTAVVGYTGALAAASGAMGPVIAGTTVAGTALRALPAAFGALLSPVGLVVGGLAAAGTAFFLFRDHTAEAMERSTDSVRNFAREAEQVLDDLSRTMGVSSTSINQARIGVAQTAIAASNAKVDASAKTYLDKYTRKGDLLGTGAAVQDAQSYLAQVASSDGAEKDRFRTQGNKQRSAQALVDASDEARKLQKQFYSVQDDVEKKRIGEENLAAVKVSENAKPKTGNVNDILGDGRKPSRGDLKDARSILNDNLESGLKQEKIQLGRELIDIETQLAAQTISASVAQERKNAATEASLEIERLWIEQSLADAKLANDKVQIIKFQNDLDENALKREKQHQQAVLDLTTVRTADKNAIEDIGLASRRYADDLKFEIEMLGKTTLEVANLRIERERSRTEENIKIRKNRNLDNPEVTQALREENEARADAQRSDAAYQESWVGGWEKARSTWLKDATSAAKQAADAFQVMSSAMENALNEFLTTGKLNFADFAKSIILEMAKIEAKAALANVSKSIGGGSGLLGLLGGLFGSGGNTSTTSVLSAGGVANSTPFAKGGVFSGTPSLGQYVNTVQSRPTSFAYQNVKGFAKGGVFAEAGSEAVMPLTRDSKGRLGVRAQNDSQMINITVHVNGNSNAPDVRRAAGQGAREALSAFKGAQRYA